MAATAAYRIRIGWDGGMGIREGSWPAAMPALMPGLLPFRRGAGWRSDSSPRKGMPLLKKKLIGRKTGTLYMQRRKEGRTAFAMLTCQCMPMLWICSLSAYREEGRRINENMAVRGRKSIRPLACIHIPKKRRQTKCLYIPTTLKRHSPRKLLCI